MEHLGAESQSKKLLRLFRDFCALDPRTKVKNVTAIEERIRSILVLFEVNWTILRDGQPEPQNYRQTHMYRALKQYPVAGCNRRGGVVKIRG